MNPSTKAEVTVPIIHKIGVPIKRAINIFINLSACKLKSKTSKGDKIIIGRHVIIQIVKDLAKKLFLKEFLINKFDLIFRLHNLAQKVFLLKKLLLIELETK